MERSRKKTLCVCVCCVYMYHTCIDAAVATTVVLRQGEALRIGRRNAKEDWEQRREEDGEAGATGKKDINAMRMDLEMDA